jgi:hypothetical protein
MIVGAESRIHPVGSFVTGLRRAAKGVLLVRQMRGTSEVPEALTTGWLVTDSLVIVPGYVIAGKFTYSCRPAARGPEIEMHVIDSLAEGSPETRSHLPAVLRLTEPIPGRALRLATTSAGIDESMFILHHAAGKQLQISIGRFIATTAEFFRYDADTEPGSGGGPIFSDRSWDVIGMHMISLGHEKQNEGIPVGMILDALRKSAAWAEIADYHRLANVTAAREVLSASPMAEGTIGTAAAVTAEPAKLKAAVHWNFDPNGTANRDELKPLVVDASANQWALKTHERQRILDGTHSLAELQAARGHAVSEDPGQKVIDRILKGPPYPLSEINEADLPYWLQAVRWFAKAIPDLPSTVDISQALARRRIRSGLREIVGEAMRGRAMELKRLDDWFHKADTGPMVVTGIGGVGKSTLVAQFALLQPESMPLLWLDFDRADLAPDDAVSVLKIISDQMSVQVDGFSKIEVDEKNWESQADLLGIALERASAQTATLMILDGFEVAQHTERHSEIWRVLESILQHAPHLRVVVSGRAPVRNLKLRGKLAESLHLTGIPQTAAVDWLQEKGIDNPVIRERVAKLSNGVPLLLRLALHLFEHGGMDDLPEKLPQAFVEGFLYDRILDRVMDAELKPLACDALVLRTVTEGILQDILFDSMPAGIASPEIFKRLAQEMALVDPGNLTPQPMALNVGNVGRLQLRPEVRSATLRLLETDRQERVREIDRRALAWYQQQDREEISNAAELVYHSLRLGNIKEAEQAWRQGCADLLGYVEDDLNEKALSERAWLKAKVAGNANDLVTWETEAVARVRAHIRRGLERTIPAILTERAERSAQSPLVFYDAWVRWNSQDLAGARAILDAAEPADGVIERDRTILRAVIAASEGRRGDADQFLAKIQAEDIWPDRARSGNEALAILAARVRLTIDLEAELNLLMPQWRTAGLEEKSSAEQRETIARILRPSDLVLAEFFNIFGAAGRMESLSGIPIPSSAADLGAFQAELDEYRENEGRHIGTQWFTPLSSPPESMAANLFEPVAVLHSAPAGGVLAVMGWRRWWLASTTMFLRDAGELVFSGPHNSFTLSIIASLLPFRSISLSYHHEMQVEHLLAAAVQSFMSVPTLAPSGSIVALAQNLIPALREFDSGRLADAVQATLDMIEKEDGREHPWIGTVFERFALSSRPSGQTSLLLFALSPDPLELLCQRAACPPSNE